MSASGNSAVVSPLAFLPSLGHMGQRLQHVKMLLDSPNEDSSAAISNRAQRILLKNYVKEHANALFSIDKSLTQSGKLVSSLFFHPMIDWEILGLSPTIRATAIAFETHFLNDFAMLSFPLLLRRPSPGEVTKIFTDYVVNLKERYHEKKDVPSEKSERLRSTIRKRSRRKYRFLRRSDLLEQHDFSTKDKETIQFLGADGMSSDDSEGEIRGKERRLFVRRLPWRNPAITQWLHSIDRFPNVGEEPDRRHIERLPGTGATERSPAPRLPRVLYSEAWLLQQSRMTIERLQISTSILQLPCIPHLTTGPITLGVGDLPPSPKDEFMGAQMDQSNASPFFATDNSLGLQEISSAPFPTASAVEYELVSSSKTVDIPQDLDLEQWHRMFSGTFKDAGLPQGSGSIVGSPRQESLANMPSTRGDVATTSSLIQESSSDSVHVCRKQRRNHSLTVTHPVVSPVKSVLDQELLGLIDTTHFERFPKSIRPMRLTRGRFPGYYNALFQSGDSSDDSMDSSDEWAPSKA